MAGKPRFQAAKQWLADHVMWVLWAVGIAIVGVGVWVLFFYIEKPEPHFAIEVGRALLTLGTGIILGGAVKTMLDRYQDVVAGKKKAHELRERLLADLRDVHDRAEAARLMHADADSQHLRELIRCQVVLLKVMRSLDLHAAETKEVDPGRVLLAKLIGYLRVLQDEYTSKDTHSPVLQDLTTSAAIYREGFKKPLYKLSGQLLGDNNAQLNERAFDTRVEQVMDQLKPPPTK